MNSNWKYVPFSDLFDWCQKSNIGSREGKDNGKYPLYIASATEIKRYDEYLESGESLVFGTGGNPCIHFVTGKFAYTNHTEAAKKRNDSICTKFYYYYFQKNRFSLLQSTFVGGGIKNSSKKKIGALLVPIVNTTEQERIVARIEEMFSQLDAGTETLLKTKAQLAVYRQAVLGTAFEGDYPKKQLKDISKAISGYAFKSSMYAEEGKYIVIKIGKPLTNLEKTKSFLMYKAAVGLSEPSQLIGRVQERFKGIYRDFMDIERSIRDENAVLQYCFISFEKWSNQGKQKGYQHYMEHMKQKADDYIQSGNEEEFQNYIDQYTLDIQQSFSAIKAMFKSNHPEFLDIISLGRVANFLPLLLKCYRIDETEEKYHYRRICHLCEIFSFRVYVILEYKTSKSQTTWYEMARDFSGDFDKLESTIVSLIKSIKTDDEFIKRLSRPDFFTTYSSLDKNYFFWKYENYLRDKEQPVATPMSHQDLNEKKDTRLTLTIEHIVAQRNSEEQSKVVNPNLPINVGRAKQFNDEYLHSIGNLTIDPQSANSSKGKSDVKTKNDKYFVLAPYKCQNELGAFLDGQKWTITSITNRRDKILKFARATWCDFSKFSSAEVSVGIELSDDETDVDISPVAEE